MTAHATRGVEDDSARSGARDAAPAPRVRRGILGLLALFVALFFFELPGARLIDRDESRYAEIPREMLVSGDFVTPRLNGSSYFEKPPLHYWLVAAAQRLLGPSPYSARLPARLATVGTAALLLFEGGGLLGGAAGAWAALAFLSAPLVFVLGRQNLIDPVLTFFLTWALLAAYRALVLPPGRSRRRTLLALGVATGWAMLAKGLVAIVLPGLVVLGWVAVMGEWGRVRGLLLSPAPLAFFAIAMPWFVLVERANPGFARFFFVHEHFQRFATEEAGRVQPVYFFAPVFAVGFLPWTPLLGAPLRTLGRPWLARLRGRPAELWLLLWLVVVLGFFSISRSKLMPYILPAMPAAAALVGRALARGVGSLERPLLVHALSWSLILPVGLVLGLRHGELTRSGLLGPALLAGAALLGLAWAALLVRRRSSERGLLCALGGWAPLFLCASLAQPAVSATHTSETLLAGTVGAGETVVLYRAFFQSAPLALGRPLPVVGTRSELASDGRTSPALFWTPEEFWRRWDSGEPMTALLRAVDGGDFTRPDRPAPVRVGATGRYLVLSNHAPGGSQP